MKQFHLNQTHLIDTSNELSNNVSNKLFKLKYFLQNSKLITIANSQENFVENLKSTTSIRSSDFSQQKNQNLEMSKDFSLYLSLIEKPLNLLFSVDQFLFEFSKKTYQQKKTGEFFQQLKERKKLSLFYGHLTRKQIINMFNKVKKNKGYFTKNLFSLLETRLDVVLYRSGLVETVAEARQLIKHKKILVNQQIINVPSYSLNVGDFISIKSKIVNISSNQFDNSLKTTDKKNFNFVLKNEFYSKFTQILSFSREKQKLKPFFRKSKKSLISFPKERKKILNFQSKFFCNLLIQLLCTKMKDRSYWNLKKNSIYSNQLNSNDSSINLKNFFLTMFKWKSFSQKKDFFSKKFTENFGSNLKKKSFFLPKKSFKGKSDPEQNVYPNQGCLQKKPAFWSLSFQKNNKLFFKNYPSQQIFHSKFKRHLNPLNKKNQRFYRTSFFVFLKHLENSNKFKGLMTLSMNKFLFKKSKKNLGTNSRNLVPVTKIVNLKRIRPLHIEVSFKLLNVVYLFSPQRINFPFYIDLDLINRSLR